MDTSGTYIKMCEEANEIQENYKPSASDFAVRCCELDYKDYCAKVGLVSWNRNQGQEQLRWRIFNEEDGIILDYENSQDNWLQKLVWLPRQDQLQKMITIDIISKYVKLTTIDTSLYWNRLTALWNWVDKLGANKDFYANKLMELEGEQLWLAFVMKEKFGKIWNGEFWVKEN